jgi:hypothetical protein
MVVAIIVGAGFGFVLERAGFGRADVLASIFYGRDFRVMRVMFTAIVTAMVGLYVLDLVGIMPLGAIGLLPTYVLPQLVGGLLLGVGFITGGYCPGTSLVATASGKLDGLLFVGGIFIGSLLFTLSYGWLEGFHTSSHLGRVLIHEYLGISSGVMVFIVTLFAVGALWAVTRIEALVNRRATRSKATRAAAPRSVLEEEAA